VPWYHYEGHTAGGVAISGRLEAADWEAARNELVNTMQVALGDIREVTEPPPPGPIREDEFIFFNEQLASLASAGMALDVGLAQVARDVDNPRLRAMIEGVAESLRRGAPLDEAVARFEPNLPVLYTRVLRAGIQSGQLPTTLFSLNQHLRLMGETRRLLWETLSYPLLVLVLATGVATFVFRMVVPSFVGVFEDFGTQLPGLTVAMVDFAEAFPMLLAALIVVLVAGALGWHALRYSAGGRTMRERLIAHLPVIGRVYRASLFARFARGTAICAGNGIPLPDGLRLAGDVTGSEGMRRDAETLARAAERGESILAATQMCRWIPAIFGYTLQIAAGRDALPTALMQVASSFEGRAAHIQAMLRVLLFPLCVIVIGSIVLLAILALFLPLVHLINCVSGGV
jgi:type II secretory pathway component PulF